MSRARLILLLVATCGSAASAFTVMGSVLVAVPSIGADLEVPQSDLQWIADSYPLALACMLLPAGVLADRFGRRRALILGLVLVTVAGILASQADTSGQLIAALIAAGVGSGVAFPSTLSTLSVVVPPDQRHWAIGLWSAAVPVGGIIGCLVGGVMIEIASWREIYLAVAGLTGTALVLTIVSVPETRERDPARFDALGTTLSVVAVAGFVLGLTDGPVHGWGETRTLVLLAVGLSGATAFVLWELRTDHPMLDVRLFALPSFGTAAVAIFVVFASLYGLTSLYFQYQAYVMGIGTLESAIRMVPIVCTMIPCAMAGAILARRFGSKLVIAVSLTAGVAGGAALALAAGQHEYALLVPGILLFGVCLGIGAGPVTEAITTELPAAQQGVASAVNSISRELGATMGIAVCGTAFNIGYRHEVDATLDPGADPIASAVEDSPAAGLQVAAQAGAGAGRYLEVVYDASTLGFTVAMVTLGAANLAALVFFLLRFPRAGERTAFLTGTVFAADGTPVVRARLTMLDPSGKLGDRGFTDAKGRYALAVPDDGWLLVCAADGMRPHIGPPVPGQELVLRSDSVPGIPWRV